MGADRDGGGRVQAAAHGKPRLRSPAPPVEALDRGDGRAASVRPSDGEDRIAHADDRMGRTWLEKRLAVDQDAGADGAPAVAAAASAAVAASTETRALIAS
jgi:hypothetical protein